MWRGHRQNRSICYVMQCYSKEWSIAKIVRVDCLSETQLYIYVPHCDSSLGTNDRGATPHRHEHWAMAPWLPFVHYTRMHARAAIKTNSVDPKGLRSMPFYTWYAVLKQKQVMQRLCKTLIVHRFKLASMIKHWQVWNLGVEINSQYLLN